MQQEPVHRDSQKLRKALRRKISSESLFANPSLLKEVEDYFLPTIAFYYYLDNTHDDFIKYLEDLDLGNENYRFITKILANYARGFKNGLGDLHPGGSTKLLVGNKVVYERYPDYGGLLSSLASCIYPDFKKFFPKINKIGETFERDFVVVNKTARSKVVLKDFYLNLGRIIPFLLFIRSIDLNAENGLVNLPYPVFFDMETIFSGDFVEGFDDYGVKNSGLVKVDEKNDSSFLTGGLKEQESLLKPLLCGTSKKPYIGWRTKSKRSYNNQPEVEGMHVNPFSYLADIEKGYFDSVELLLRKKEELREIIEENDAYIRVVMRPTRMYRFLILKSCYPQVYLKNNRKHFMKNSLETYNLIYRFKGEKLLEKETEALLSLKVPVFYSSLREKEIFCPSEGRIGTWYNTPYEVWEEYFMKMEKAFFQKQWSIVVDSLN